MQRCNDKGMCIDNYELRSFEGERNCENFLTSVFKNIVTHPKYRDPNFIPFVLFVSDDVPNIHECLKFEERMSDIPTQHILPKNIRKIRDNIEKKSQGGRRAYDLTLDNIVMKANVKCGGLNYTADIPRDIGSWREVSTFVMGMDVAHPDKMATREGRPSTVGLSCNLAESPYFFVGDFLYTDPRREAIQDEIRKIRDSETPGAEPSRSMPRFKLLILCTFASRDCRDCLLTLLCTLFYSPLPVFRGALPQMSDGGHQDFGPDGLRLAVNEDVAVGEGGLDYSLVTRKDIHGKVLTFSITTKSGTMQDTFNEMAETQRLNVAPGLKFFLDDVVHGKDGLPRVPYAGQRAIYDKLVCGETRTATNIRLLDTVVITTDHDRGEVVEKFQEVLAKAGLVMVDAKEAQESINNDGPVATKYRDHVKKVEQAIDDLKDLIGAIKRATNA
ncbi:unnamed protein product [Caenorhabditis nigoni]